MLIVPLTLLDPLASWELCLIAILSVFSVINIIRYLRAINVKPKERQSDQAGRSKWGLGHNFVRDFPETKLVPLKKAKPLDGLLRDRPARYRLPDLNPIRPELRRNFGSVIIAAWAGIIGFAVVWMLASSPWPVTTTLRHIASAPNCDFARLVGLAPARRGEPGYWERHDRDGDGIACEPWLPRRGK